MKIDNGIAIAACLILGIGWLFTNEVTASAIFICTAIILSKDK